MPNTQSWHTERTDGRLHRSSRQTYAAFFSDQESRRWGYIKNNVCRESTGYHELHVEGTRSSPKGRNNTCNCRYHGNDNKTKQDIKKCRQLVCVGGGGGQHIFFFVVVGSISSFFVPAGRVFHAMVQRFQKGVPTLWRYKK